MRNQAALTALLNQIYDPSSPDYRHFLSVADFADRFGPTPDNYQAVVAFAKAHGLKVKSLSANRMTVPVEGTVEQVEDAFNVKMHRYQHPTETREFFSPDREPSVPAGLSVRHIAGLNNYSLPMSMAKRLPAESRGADAEGSGPGGNYMASDMRAAYYGGTSLTGRGQRLGLIQFDGYDIADVISTFNGEATLGESGGDPVVNYTPPNSKTTYAIPVHNVLLDSATGAPGQFMPPADDAEQVLDIVQSIGMAPGLSQVRVYIGSSDVDILSTIASENLANEVSISWAWVPEDSSIVDQFFQEMALQGQSVFAASGDYGAYSPEVPYYFPAEDQWVTAVGGTHLTTDGAGGPFTEETAWSQSGGGISPDAITMPSWQAGIANSSNLASNTLRNVPDVAMEADFDNWSCSMGGCALNWAGTSFAAPRWAAFTALANEQATAAGDPPAGFLNPRIYATGLGSSYGSEFHDTAIGENNYEAGYGFYAIPGYDLATGWGSPSGQNLIDALAPRGMAGFQLTTSKSSLTINPGNTATSTIGVTYVGGFTGNVLLAVTSTLPAGVTASFSANPTGGTSVLTLTANMLSAVQSFNVTITGTSGNLQAATYVGVDIPTNAVVILEPAVPTVPVTAEEFKPGVIIPVDATVLGNPRSVTLHWAAGVNPTSGWQSQGITFSGTSSSSALVGTWDTSSITNAGYYTIQLSAIYPEGTTSATTLVYLEPDLISADWPKWLGSAGSEFSGIMPFDDISGKTMLAVVQPEMLASTASPSYRIFSPDGSSDQSIPLSFGTYLSPAFGHLLSTDGGEDVLPDARNVVVIDNDYTPSNLPLNGANLQFQASQLILADLKGDSSLASVTYGLDLTNKFAYVFAWDSNRQLLNSNFPIRVPYQNTGALFNWNQGVAVGDIDGDGRREIIALESQTDSTFTFALFNNDGTPLSWAAPTFTGIPCEMILVDLDGNGKLELVVAMMPPPQTQTGATRWAIHVLQPDGTERPGWPIWASSGSPYLAAGDLARTGKAQIVASSWNTLFVLNGDGTPYSSAWPITNDGFHDFGAPVLADIDGDGYPEILVTEGGYSADDQSAAPTMIPSSYSQSAHAILTPARVQTNASTLDSTPAYFTPILKALHSDGTTIRTWHIPGAQGDQPYYLGRLAVGDFNHDGTTDIAVLDMLVAGGTTNGWLSEGVIEVLKTGAPFNPAANDWPMLYRDSSNSSIVYPFGPNSARAAAPSINLTQGTSAGQQTVTISDTTPGAVIYYTTDGTIPTTGSSRYWAPVSVPASQTIQAIATSTGYLASPISPTGNTEQTATPTYSVAGGVYASPQTLTISDSTPDAVIYYTTNGSTPTISSTPYSGPVTVSSTETLRAIATASGYSTSAVASAAYTINLPAATPAFNIAPGTYPTVQTVSIGDTTPGTVIHYTTNGSTPTTSSTPYSGAITVSSTETLRAIATASGYSTSAVASAAYTITPPAATPTFSPTAGTYTSTQSVSISDTTPGATVYYTTNGSIPTASSTHYTGPISVSSTETLESIAVAAGYSNSTAVSAKYTITLPAAAPAFSPAGGSYTSKQTVTISDATPGAVIYYTTNGTAPTTSSTRYTGPVAANSTETLEAIAVAAGYSNSTAVSARYSITPIAATPTFSPTAGTYTSTQSVSISDTTPGAAVYYTTNGSIPTASSTHYTGPISVSSTQTLESIAVAAGYSNSAAVSARYTITLPAAAPAFSPAGGSYTSKQTVTISDATPGAVIYYTTNGTAPTTSSTRYTGSIAVSSTETLESIAVAAGYSNSTAVSAKYTITLPAAAPAFSPAGGSYTSKQTVTISDATPGAVIYYTTNGTAPTTSSTRYTGPVAANSTETLEAIAVAAGYSNSTAVSARYTITLPAAAPAFSPAGGSYTSRQTVTISDATPGAVIYYTTNGTAPTTSSTRYTGSIAVSSTETLESIAVAAGYSNSTAVSARYTITPPAAAPRLQK